MTARRIIRLAGLLAVIITYSVLTSFAFTPSSEASEHNVTRIPKFTTVAAGQNLTIEIQPTNVPGFYAVDETFGELELISDTADDLVGGVFIMIQGTKFEYVVKIPESAQPCDTFEIAGMWWTDPNDKSPVEPDPFIIEVPSVSPCDQAKVTRIPESTTVSAGQNLTIEIQPTGVPGFYAVDETFGGLELISYTADDLVDGVFIMIQGTKFEYVVKIPESAQLCDTFEITGLWWTDPDHKSPVEPNPLVIKVIPCDPPPGSAPFKLLPAVSEQPAGKEFKIQIWTNAASSQEISGVQVFVDFNKSRLQVVDSDLTKDGVQIKQVFTTLAVPLANETDNGTGQVTFASGTIGTPYPKGSFMVAEITFMGIKDDLQPTDIVFSFESTRLTAASVLGNAVLGQHENASVLITPVVKRYHSSGRRKQTGPERLGDSNHGDILRTRH